MSEWWHGAVIYQIYPRSFCDSNGDGIGDLAGITSKLEYVAYLGVDAVWISPFFKSPMKDFGYDVEDFRQVDPVFGDLDDFDTLVSKAHSLGLKVVIDQVYSHSSDQCDWFIESRQGHDNNKADWYTWANAKDDGSPPNNWQSAFGGPAWTWDDTRQQYYLHNFLPEQPDLNLHNHEVREELLEIARFWLDRGVDGFRLDATNHFMHDPSLPDNPDEHVSLDANTDNRVVVLYNASHPDTVGFLKEVRAVLDQYPDRFSVAEVGGPNSLRDIRQFTQGSDRLNTGYSFVFLNLKELSAQAIGETVRYWDDFETVWPSWTFNNHDGPRVVSRWGNGFEPVQLAKTLQTLLVMLRGTLFMYQGEELGLPQADIPFEKLKDPEAIANWPDTMGRDGARTPIPWSGRDTNGGWPDTAWMPLDESHFALNASRQQKEADSPLAYCRRLLQFRKQHPALADGSISFIECPKDMLVFIRANENESILCVFNLGKTEQQWIPKGAGVGTSKNWLFEFGGADQDNPFTLPSLGGYIKQAGTTAAPTSSDRHHRRFQ